MYNIVINIINFYAKIFYIYEEKIYKLITLFTHEIINSDNGRERFERIAKR
jgi:hypothetical protein